LRLEIQKKSERLKVNHKTKMGEVATTNAKAFEVKRQTQRKTGIMSVREQHDDKRANKHTDRLPDHCRFP